MSSDYRGRAGRASGWSLRSRANAVVVAQVLGVRVIAQLVLSKHSAPGAEAVGNLTLVPAQIGKEENVGLVEGEVAAHQEVNALESLGVQVVSTSNK